MIPIYSTTVLYDNLDSQTFDTCTYMLFSVIVSQEQMFAADLNLFWLYPFNTAKLLQNEKIMLSFGNLLVTHQPQALSVDLM